MEDKIMVSVCCTVYNHEKYLRKCLDGFMMQKTNFSFEVLINDDKSSDSSAEIIREYCKKYPKVIIPVFQIENQYSKGVQIINDILLPLARGKYIALCEGDDYWCNENKLQLQYDYMENNSECVMCLHNTVFHDLNSSRKDRLFNNWKKVHVLNAEEVFLGCNVHTSSYFMKKEYSRKPNFGRGCWAGDAVILTWLYTIGELAVLPQVMSVYNFGVDSGLRKSSVKSIENKRKFDSQLITYFENLDYATKYKFTDIIKRRIKSINFDMLYFEKCEIIKNSQNRKEIIKAAKAIVSHEYYSEYIKSKPRLKRFFVKFKYEGYIIYPVWRFIWQRI